MSDLFIEHTFEVNADAYAQLYFDEDFSNALAAFVKTWIASCSGSIATATGSSAR